MLNVKGPKVGVLKRKDNILPYYSPRDSRFKVKPLQITLYFPIYVPPAWYFILHVILQGSLVLCSIRGSGKVA